MTPNEWDDYATESEGKSMPVVMGIGRKQA